MIYRICTFIIICVLAFGCQKRELSKTVLGSQTPSPILIPPSMPSGLTPNANVFKKNPVYAAQNSIGYDLIATGTSITTSQPTQIDFDSYLVPVSILGSADGYLENSDIKFYPDENGVLKRARPDSSGFWILHSARVE